MAVFNNLYLQPGSKAFNLNVLQSLGTFNSNFDTPLTGNVILNELSDTWQYLNPGGSDRDIDFITTNLIGGEIHIILNTEQTGNNKLNIFVDGVNTGISIKRAEIFLTHYTDTWNFIKIR